jgi:hypothetical protein
MAAAQNLSFMGFRNTSPGPVGFFYLKTIAPVLPSGAQISMQLVVELATAI